MRLALAQINPTVGDVEGNARLVREAAERAAATGADAVLCPEMVLLGYPPRDLLWRDGAVEACERAVRDLAAASIETAIIVGHPRRVSGARRDAANSASVLRGGRVVATYDKQLLPGYDVFDEDRYFEPGRTPRVVDIADRRAGILICEDIWQARDVEGGQHLVPAALHDPVREAVEAGAQLLLILSASPFVAGKGERHISHLRNIARTFRVPVAMVNQVGANDDLIFDGRSIVVGADGEVQAAARAFESDFVVLEVGGGAARRQPSAVSRQPSGGDARHETSDAGNPEPGTRNSHALHSSDPSSQSCHAARITQPPVFAPPISTEHELFAALVLGIRDYFRKTGATTALIGLSGGIDSALTAVLASAALGPGNIRGVMMPSRYSSPGSIEDSVDLAKRLRLGRLVEIPIESAHAALEIMLEGGESSAISRQRSGESIGHQASGTGTTEYVSPQSSVLAPRSLIPGIVGENIQARVRGVILMALSNAMPGAMVLATGNKSELATGYCTLYGDMCGALAVLGDVYKTQVWALSRWINANHAACGFDSPPIPQSSIDKPPSAELKPDQTDQDTLPPYPVLDEIIRRWVDHEEDEEAIIAATGFPPDLVRRWTGVIDRNEYKRRQAAIVLKVSPRTFGPGRPMPVAMRWRLPG